jgi:hypothetical protein
MNNLKITFPQNRQIYPQEYQHSTLVLNKKKPEASLSLWVKRSLLLGKNKLFLLMNKMVSIQPNLVIYFYTLTKTTKTNINMIKSSSMGTK